MSKTEQLITRAFDENNEWLSVVPDDYRRISSIPIIIPFLGILIMIIGIYNDLDDALMMKPLPQQLYIILAGLGLFLFSLLIIKLQYKEIRWIQNEDIYCFQQRHHRWYFP